MAKVVEDLCAERVTVDTAQAVFNGCWKIVMTASLVRKYGDYSRERSQYEWPLFKPEKNGSVVEHRYDDSED